MVCKVYGLMFVSRVYVVAATLALQLPASATAQTTAAGAQLFQQRCGACHSVVAGQNKIGPHLAGVIGRKAGSVKDARYSKALQTSAITWTARTLDPYLAAPAKVVPGTQMVIAVSNAAERAALIAYLKSIK